MSYQPVEALNNDTRDNEIPQALATTNKVNIVVDLDHVAEQLRAQEQTEEFSVTAMSIQYSSGEEDSLREIEATEGSGFLREITTTSGSGFVREETIDNSFDIDEAVAKYRSQMDDTTINVLAKMVWGEARGIPSKMEQAGTLWTVFNRYDAGYGTLYSIVTNRNMYEGYRSGNPVTQNLKDLVIDVWARWLAEKDGSSDVGRVLPVDYRWFRASGDGHNLFRNQFAKPYTIWDWSLPNPYES